MDRSEQAQEANQPQPGTYKFGICQSDIVASDARKKDYEEPDKVDGEAKADDKNKKSTNK